MNSAAELRRYTENLALEKSIKLVSDALDKEPFGLEISQLMTVCRLSAKTTKNVLSIIKAHCEDGVWFLDAKRKQESNTSITTLPAVNDLPESKVNTMPKNVDKTEDDKTENESLLKRMVRLFRENPNGITLLEALDKLNCQRTRFDGDLSYLRKNYFPVNLVKQTDGRKLYIPVFELDQKPQESEKNVPGKDTTTQTAISDVVNNSEIKPKTVPVDNAILPVADTDLEKVVKQLKLQTKTIVTTKQELHLTQNQISDLLKQSFGFDEINWTVMEVDHVVSIALSKTETTAVLK
ncbi:hypothetical protein F885_01796 [Acinetobacter higginsii]|uniref:hypothetical protein n=1 Tax=Acinetobacter higginsii TaxID=70347 RepID=UPI0002D09CC7|nr:hypothetical protein [Acinetobacter higginsii]ENX60688.1 hypothetical protein F885_01796 [Acinetobacter higginsii]